jgi:site-specific DNA-cytosine methylase
MNEVWTKSRRAQNVDDYETWIGGGVCPTLNAFDNATETRATVIAFSHTQGLDIQPSIKHTPTLRVGGNGAAVSGPVAGVRRLTPVECERLQGFPDNWTDGQADSNRYKQMGNAVSVPVTTFIASLVNAASRQELNL